MAARGGSGRGVSVGTVERVHRGLVQRAQLGELVSAGLVRAADVRACLGVAKPDSLVGRLQDELALPGLADALADARRTVSPAETMGGDVVAACTGVSPAMGR